jgi:prepilin-type N-terminal cleavage/methylation domain-containing protein
VTQLRQRGFTLFEVLVVMALIGVVTAFAAPSLIRIGNNANLRAARGALITAVNVAKSSAVTTGKCSFLRLNSNAVSVFTTSCPGGAQTEIVSNRNFGTDYSVTVTLKKGSGSALALDSLGFDPRGIPVNNSQTDTFTITKSGSTRYVVVGNYGRVN